MNLSLQTLFLKKITLGLMLVAALQPISAMEKSRQATPTTTTKKKTNTSAWVTAAAAVGATALGFGLKFYGRYNNYGSSNFTMPKFSMPNIPIEYQSMIGEGACFLFAGTLIGTSIYKWWSKRSMQKAKDKEADRMEKEILKKRLETLEANAAQQSRILARFPTKEDIANIAHTVYRNQRAKRAQKKKLLQEQQAKPVITSSFSNTNSSFGPWYDLSDNYSSTK